MSADDQKKQRRKRIAQWVCLIMLFAVLVGAMGFVYKIVQFAREAFGDTATSFAAVPLLAYVFVAVGFVLLFLWALARGQFRDVERPKYDMLEREREYERAGV